MKIDQEIAYLWESINDANREFNIKQAILKERKKHQIINQHMNTDFEKEINNATKLINNKNKEEMNEYITELKSLRIECWKERKLRENLKQIGKRENFICKIYEPKTVQSSSMPFEKLIPHKRVKRLSKFFVFEGLGKESKISVQEFPTVEFIPLFGK